MPKKKAKRKGTAPSRRPLKIIYQRGKWTVYGKDGQKGTPITGPIPPAQLEDVIQVYHVTGDGGLPEPRHGHKTKRRVTGTGKGGPSHPPWNTHCHKTIYINGVPYIVHC